MQNRFCLDWVFGVWCLDWTGFCTGGKGPPGRFEMNPTGCAEGILIFSGLNPKSISCG